MPKRKPPIGGKYERQSGIDPSSGNCGVLIAAPQLVELGRRQQRRPVGLDGLIAREHGLAGLVVSGHHSAHTHAASQSPRRVTPLPISLRSNPTERHDVMSQREISLAQLTATRASGAVVLIRLYVGLIFVGEGFLKFLRPEALGPGRFEKAGIPAGAFFANLDGAFEIGCGVLILVGLLVRLATLPMIVDMIGALADHQAAAAVGQRTAVSQGRRLLGLLPRRPPRDRDAVRQRLPAHRRRRRVLIRQPDEPRRRIRPCHRCRGLAQVHSNFQGRFEDGDE